MSIRKRLFRFGERWRSIPEKFNSIQEALGRIENRQIGQLLASQISEAEFKVYSQSGEDGIIQFLVSKVPVSNRRFIEFGVENYVESNTRFLALNNYWSGLVIDGDSANIEFVKSDPIYWRCNIKAECSFITKDNINDLFRRNGITGDIGLLSIDIDGNDYWVWEAIDCVNPCIIVAEYNSMFGPDRKVTVPYNPAFARSAAHYTKIFYGASIAALTHLANKRGYRLVSSNRSGNNLFFVRKDLMDGLTELSEKEAYRPINFREAHSKEGQLLYTSFDESKKLIGDEMVHDIESGELVQVKSLW